MPSERPCWEWQAFQVQKRGHAPEEYEDAFAGDPVVGSFAVADGASESSFAGEWARLLAAGHVASADSRRRAHDWLTPLQEQWAQKVDRRPLPWYAEDKRAQG